MNKAYIIHGWGASPQDNWFFWIKKNLEKNGFYASALSMPNSEFPVFSEWMIKMKEEIKPDGNTYIIGHSLGVISILKYLESINIKIKAAVLVSGFSESIGIPEIESFTREPLNYEKVKNNAENIVLIHSDNDELVPIKNGNIMKEKLNAKMIILKGEGHINTYQNKFELPIALETILSISKSNN